MAIRAALATTDPSNARWQRDLSFSFTKLASTYEQQGERLRALEHAERSLRIDERLAALDRSNVMWQRDERVRRAMVARLKAAGS